jgi:DNA-binding CsgD family transcriptional regulator
LQVAAAGRIAVSTARTHVSSLRQKTGAHSINHLLRMLAGLPPLVSKVDASEAQI